MILHHLALSVVCLEESQKFYDAVLLPLGYKLVEQNEAIVELFGQNHIVVVDCVSPFNPKKIFIDRFLQGARTAKEKSGK